MTGKNRLVDWNPFAGLELPPRHAAAIEFFETDELEAIIRAAERLFGRKWAILIDLATTTGLREGELFGLHRHRVDVVRELAQVTHVLTRDGIREYPKTKKSRRAVPLPGRVCDGIRWMDSQRLIGPQGIVFAAPRGGLINESDYRLRIWYPAVEAARLCGQLSPVDAEDGDVWIAGRCGRICDDPGHRVRRYPPRITRHTAASRLVQAGVSLEEVQRLLGHEDFATTQLYAHLMPGKFDAIRAVW